MLVKRYKFRWIININISKIGFMNQPIFLDPNVDESTKSGHIRYNSWQDHSCAQIFNGSDRSVEFEHFCLFTWITTRFFQFGDYVIKGVGVDLREISFIQFFQTLFVSDQFFQLYL